MLRARAAEEDGKSEHMDSRAADLAWIVAGKIEDQFVARDLVSDVTVTFTDFQLAGFKPPRPDSSETTGRAGGHRQARQGDTLTAQCSVNRPFCFKGGAALSFFNKSRQ
jgi:hypothetical protein